MSRIRAAVAAAAVVGLALPSSVAFAADGAPAPIDPQSWSWQDELTWNDYKALPGTDYSNSSVQPSVKKWKVALVVTDFQDKTFTISQPEGGTAFGTPTASANSIPRDQVPAFYRDWLNTPSAANHYQTMNRYWMEDSFGRYGVQLDAFGPYKLPGRSYQYFMTEFGGAGQAATARIQPTSPATRTSAPTRAPHGRRTSARPRSPSTTTSSTSRPARTSRAPGRSSAR